MSTTLQRMIEYKDENTGKWRLACILSPSAGTNALESDEYSYDEYDPKTGLIAHTVFDQGYYLKRRLFDLYNEINIGGGLPIDASEDTIRKIKDIETQTEEKLSVRWIGLDNLNDANTRDYEKWKRYLEGFIDRTYTESRIYDKLNEIHAQLKGKTYKPDEEYEESLSGEFEEICEEIYDDIAGVAKEIESTRIIAGIAADDTYIEHSRVRIIYWLD